MSEKSLFFLCYCIAYFLDLWDLSQGMGGEKYSKEQNETYRLAL